MTLFALSRLHFVLRSSRASTCITSITASYIGYSFALLTDSALLRSDRAVRRPAVRILFLIAAIGGPGLDTIKLTVNLTVNQVILHFLWAVPFKRFLKHVVYGRM